ncbi:MAG TPA: IclR family transcriptional regulator [Bryobacteraceae bacterium]|nr:IclR family transcriptional regulator [Bryobacteraceae bacterium]
MAQAKYPVKSLAKALRLLDALGHADSGASIAFLSKELKMGKSTIHRLLATLREFDLVWFDPSTSNYALGARILRWSDLLVRQNLVIRHGWAILRELVQACHETASLAVLEGTDVVFIARCESTQRLRMSEQVGGRNPAHCTALGKAILAALPEKEFLKVYDGADALKAVTPNSITSREKLWDHLRKVQQEGVAYDFEENVAGGVCIGTAVRNHTGNVVAGMSLSLPTQRLRGDILITLKEHLVRAAGLLSSELGYTGDRPEVSAASTGQGRRRAERVPQPTSV